MITYAVVHLVFGILGAIMIVRDQYNRGIDFTVADLLSAILGATILGPFLFVIVVVLSFDKYSKVLIKGKQDDSN